MGPQNISYPKSFQYPPDNLPVSMVDRSHLPSRGTNAANRLPLPGYSVLLVDDQESYLQMTRSALEKDSLFMVVAEANEGKDAIMKAGLLDPDLVLMDVQMPVMDGIEATRSIVNQNPNAKVVLVSMSSDREYHDVAKEIGALGFIPKKRVTTDSLLNLLGWPDLRS